MIISCHYPVAAKTTDGAELKLVVLALRFLESLTWLFLSRKSPYGNGLKVQQNTPEYITFITHDIGGFAAPNIFCPPLSIGQF